MRRLWPLFTLILASGAAAQVGSATSFAPPDWPALDVIAKKVPAFAGFTWGKENGKSVVRLALTATRQEKALRSALKDDTSWNERMSGWSIGAGVVRMKTPVSRLLEVARKVKAERPNAEVRIDTAFGRVRLSASDVYTRALAAKLKVDDLLVDNEWQPPLTVQYDVQPRTVKLSSVSGDPFHAVSGLRVLVKNVGSEVNRLAVSCGGQMPVEVVTATGAATPQFGHIGCTQEASFRLIQPGEIVTFPSFPWNDLRKLTLGRYAWVLGKQRFPFVLTK